MSSEVRSIYSVESTEERPGHIGISLVRCVERDVTHHLRHHAEVVERTVLFHRTFRPMLELAA